MAWIIPGVTNSVNFAANQVSNTFTIPIINGTTVQPDKTVNLRLSLPTGGCFDRVEQCGADHHQQQFTSPDTSPFQPRITNANENAGTALITVDRLGGSAGTLTVTVMTSDGTATNGVNYVGSTNTLTWNDTIAAASDHCRSGDWRWA